MTESKWIKVAIHRSQLEKIDKLVENQVHSSRQSAINYYVRRGLESQESVNYYKQILDSIVSKIDNLSSSLQETKDEVKQFHLQYNTKKLLLSENGENQK